MGVGHPFFESDRFFISESDNIHDMCLMSMCNYNIIANSTFSWWGAWLAGHDRVIAPKLWFGPDGEDPTDIYMIAGSILMSQISICIPTYEYKGRGVEFLAELFDSIERQNFQRF